MENLPQQNQNKAGKNRMILGIVLVVVSAFFIISSFLEPASPGRIFVLIPIVGFFIGLIYLALGFLQSQGATSTKQKKVISLIAVIFVLVSLWAFYDAWKSYNHTFINNYGMPSH